MSFSTDSKLGELLDNPVTNDILLKHLPQLKDAGPMLAMARGMALSTVSRMSGGRLPADKLAAIAADLEKL